MATRSTTRAATINLDQLITESTASAIRSFKEFERDRKIINPRIWVGIWIEPFGPGDIVQRPGG